MSWASAAILKLQQGETVQLRPRGHSMRGRVESGQLVTITPVDESTLAVDDIVLCAVRGVHYLHLIKARQGARFQIGNNRGGINGWIGARAIYGRCVRIDP